METIEPMSIALYGNLRKPLVSYGQNDGSDWGLIGDFLVNFILTKLKSLTKIHT